MQQEWVDENFLASSHVRTPDPRQEKPPRGQRLLIGWDFPRSLFQENLTLVARIRFWDNREEVLSHPIERRRDAIAFDFFQENQKILTYQVQVLSGTGATIEVWEHHFWTELIDIDRQESRSAAQSNSDSVSSHPMQESVTEMP